MYVGRGLKVRAIKCDKVQTRLTSRLMGRDILLVVLLVVMSLRSIVASFNVPSTPRMLDNRSIDRLSYMQQVVARKDSI